LDRLRSRPRHWDPKRALLAIFLGYVYKQYGDLVLLVYGEEESRGPLHNLSTSVDQELLME
jgi:hypothetical protein